MSSVSKKEFSKYDEFRVILTREKDVYLKLRERTEIAKNSNADIFISLLRFCAP